jgi:hypothetical protein
MGRSERKKLIKKIEDQRGTKVITYITSDRPGAEHHMFYDVVPILHKHILALNKEDDLKLDLFIYSLGGVSDVPWAIVSMFREYSKKGSFSVLIPYRAYSAATMLALGADEIVMSKKAELGPIDITHEGPYNPRDPTNKPLPISVEDVNGYFSLLERTGCGRPDEKMKSFELLTNHVHPLALGKVNRSLEQTKLVAERLLNTRSSPFTEEENKSIVKRISSEIYSHSHSINRTEALNYLGLKQVKTAEDEKIDKELWMLYEEYKELFKLENPLRYEDYLLSNEKENHTWKDINMACIESCNRQDTLRKDFHVQKLRKVPPEINMNLNNLNIPPINILNLPDGITPEQINQLVINTTKTIIQDSLNNTVPLATKEIIKALPHAGFEKSSFNIKWVKEV